MQATIQPLEAAVRRLGERTPVASKLNSAQWQELSLGLRERAFFSAGVEKLRMLAAMQAKIDEALTLAGGPDSAFMDRSKFVAEMRNALGAPEGDSGSLTDLASTRRLGLVYDFQKESATEYARWQVAQDPDLLEAFPCQELLRVEDREVQRDWESRWTAAGGAIYAGRMIARRDAGVWYKISRFGTPYPPFDFGSGMGVADVERDEAIALGVIPADAVVQPQSEGFNARLEASVPQASPALMEGFKAIFGDQVAIDAGGKIRWIGGAK